MGHRAGDTTTVDQHLEWTAEFVGNHLQHRRVGYINLQGAVGCTAHRRHHLVGPLSAGGVADDHLESVVGQAETDLTADAAASPDDQRQFGHEVLP